MDIDDRVTQQIAALLCQAVVFLGCRGGGATLEAHALGFVGLERRSCLDALESGQRLTSVSLAAITVRAGPSRASGSKKPLSAKC